MNPLIIQMLIIEDRERRREKASRYVPEFLILEEPEFELDEPQETNHEESI